MYRDLPGLFKRSCLIFMLNLLFIVFTDASPGNTLVLLDTLNTKTTHSDFFDLLTARGYKLTFKQANEADIDLKKYGEYLYKHLILFSPTTDEFGGSVNAQALTEFIDEGGNILAAVNSRVGSVMKELAAECGFEVDHEGSAVIDHLSFDKVLDKGDHTTIIADPARGQLTNIAPMLGGASASDFSPILFKGIGLITDRKNLLVTNVLRGSPSTYSALPTDALKSTPLVAGESASLIATLQARNNARVLFSGSLLLFSNAYLRATVAAGFPGETVVQSGNKKLVEALAAWTFREYGVLRYSQVKHGGPYTIMDPATFSMKVETLDQAGRWVPYTHPTIQMEFVRIDPFVRTDLKLVDASVGRYEANFRVPDVYGVYQFRVEHRRPGYDRLAVSSQVSVHPLQHTDYERFIPAARPYVFSAFSMMLGLLLFSFVFIHHIDDAQDDSKKAKRE